MFYFFLLPFFLPFLPPYILSLFFLSFFCYPLKATFEWPLGAAPLTTEDKLLVKIKDKEEYWINR